MSTFCLLNIIIKYQIGYKRIDLIQERVVGSVGISQNQHWNIVYIYKAHKEERRKSRPKSGN
jgi:hypothetical protein